MEAFVRVVDAGSFSGAAKQLRLGQPAVSKTIAQLEERLGVRLLLRSTHGLTATEAGGISMNARSGPSRKGTKPRSLRVVQARRRPDPDHGSGSEEPQPKGMPL
jgi:hypothetical protein